MTDALDDGTTPTAGPRPVVLIVDDRPENLLALEAVLEPLHLDVVRATSGEGALRRLLGDDGRDVAVIILDVQMPGMDGFETAEHIKSREKTRYIPIIFLTAISTESTHALRGYETGAVDYVSKPFNPDVLRAKVGVLVELQQHARTIEEQRVLLAERLVERDLAQATLARQTLELERSNAELERFATVVSTEMRDPMHLIAGFLDLLGDRHGQALGEDGCALLGRAVDAADRLIGGVDQLLAYATVSTATHAADLVELDDVVEGVTRSLQGRLDHGGVTLTTDPLPAVTGDHWQLIRLLTHLVDNALVHAGPGIEIHIGVSRRDGNWVISVRDDGAGMSETSRTRLFTLLGPGNGTRRPGGTNATSISNREDGRNHPVASVRAAGDEGDGEAGPEGVRGRGVGLAIARRIVERHGGSIWADSVPGQGTTISFTLPPGEDAAAEDLHS